MTEPIATEASQIAKALRLSWAALRDDADTHVEQLAIERAIDFATHQHVIRTPAWYAAAINHCLDMTRAGFAELAREVAGLTPDDLVSRYLAGDPDVKVIGGSSNPQLWDGA